MSRTIGPGFESVSYEGLPLGTYFAAQAAARPDVVAVSARDAALGWGELNRRANRAAHALAARGVQPGDLVTLALANGVGMLVAMVACWKLGATPQPLSYRSTPVEFTAIVEVGRPAAVVAEREVAAVVERAVTLDMLLAESGDETDLPDVVAPSVKAPSSGGSTGRPKLIVSHTPGVVELHGVNLYGFDADSVVLLPAPLHHNAPFSAALSTLMAGGRVVVMPKFDPEEVLRWIERERATWVYLVPTMMSRIWRLPEEVRARYDLSSIRAVWHMAAPCPAWLKRAWIDWLGPERIFELYGGTETIAFTVINGSEWLAHPGSVGRAVFGDVRILDEQGRVAAAGETGKVYLRSPDGSPLYHYVGAEPQRSGDWETLGDLGWMDGEGYLYLADRQSDMILVGGANVYPAEVEAAIEEHPLVQSCAVIGLPDDDLGNRVHAIVQPRDGFDREALLEHLAQRLSAYKRPRSVELVDGPVRDEAGKVRRGALRAARIGDAAGASEQVGQG